jgi:hypothetical protein
MKAYIVEEISTFTSYYFEPYLKTRINFISKMMMMVDCLRLGICQYLAIIDDHYRRMQREEDI